MCVCVCVCVCVGFVWCVRARGLSSLLSLSALLALSPPICLHVPITAAATYNAQSSFVLPFTNAAGKVTMVMMADRWSFPNESAATMVWLPFERTSTGEWTFEWHDEWTLDG